MRGAYIVTITVAVACSLIKNTQAQWIDPAPLWPADGDLSRFPDTQFVFYNYNASEYIVAIRFNDGSPARLLHVPRHNQVDPVVQASVSRDLEGHFHYRYSLSNGSSARIPLQRWALAIDEPYREMSVLDSKWFGAPIIAKLPGISREQHQVVQWNAPEGGALSVGQSTSGFEVRSDLAPGYILGAFFGKTPLPELTQEEWASLPLPVADQLKQCLATAWDSQVRQIIGPRFGPKAAIDVVQANFIFAIRHPELTGAPMKRSQSIEQTESLLNESLYRPGTAVTTGKLDSLSRPGAPKEAEAIDALKLTLSVLQPTVTVITPQ